MVNTTEIFFMKDASEKMVTCKLIVKYFCYMKKFSFLT